MTGLLVHPTLLLTNNTDTPGALIMGNYDDGYSHEDLMAFGSDISTRPSFINALDIFDATPNSVASVLFDHGPGTYFMVCMPAPDTMVVLEDVEVTD